MLTERGSTSPARAPSGAFHMKRLLPIPQVTALIAVTRT